MRLELTGRHLDITPALRRLVTEKCAKLERMLNDSAVSAQVVLAREDGEAPRSARFAHRATALVAVGHGAPRLVRPAEHGHSADKGIGHPGAARTRGRH